MTKQIMIYFSLLILLDYILDVTVRFFQDIFAYFYDFFRLSLISMYYLAASARP